MFKSRTPNTSENKSSSSNSFLGVQAKLNIGKSDDKYEREADAMADKVVSKTGLLGSEAFIPPSPAVQRKGNDEQEVQKQEETEQIQEKPLLNEITPLVQRKEEEGDVQAKEIATGSDFIQRKQEEEQVQSKSASEEEVQQKSAEDESVQQKEDEVDLQAKEVAIGSDFIQREQEEEQVQSKSAPEEEIQQKTEPEIQTKLDGDRTADKRIQRQVEEVQEKEEEIQEKEEDSIQKKSAGNGGDTSNLEKNLSSSKGGGSPMDAGTKGQMESGFGTDFSGVRIHNDSNAVQMNKELGAQAFTNGNDIYFNEGKYNPSSKSGQHLLAHELTHTVQQGASNQPSVQKAAAAPVPADAPALRPTVPLDITHRLNVTGEWAKYLDAEYEKKKGPIDVEVKIGERYSGTIELSRKKGTDEGELAKYEITRGTKKKYLKINGWNFLQPLRDAGIEPVLVLNNFGDEQVTTGFLSVAIKEIAVGNAKGFIDSLNENLDKMGFLGVSPITIADGFVNEFSAGRLVFQVGAMKTVVDGYLEAGGGMGITGDVFTFNVNASINVAGLASGEFMIARAEDGSFSGTADIEADIANVNAKLHVEYIDGTVTIQGTGRIQSEKFSGEITLLVTEAERSKQMMHAALGVESMDAEKEQAEAPAAPKPKSKANQVLAGWGEITANITPWLSGTAKVGIDAEGHVTIVGEITVPQEVELMEQRGKKVDIFKVEIRAGYGIPLVGQVFLFASIGMFMNAGFGPLVLKGVGFKGTYSTDPSVLQEFEITGTLNINAFAVLGLEAEAGVGVTILGHDIKAGVNVTAAAGLRAYAEATPTLQYKEQAAPQGGKMGETRLKGHFEAAAQLFMQLNGSLFYELDSPWWSPAPDGREDFPLGEVQYPIGDSMGIGADMDWLVGSPEIPELKFSPVEFDADKFTADVMADPPPKKMGKADEEKAGEWEDGNKPGDQQLNPEAKDGKGLPDTGKAKEDLKKLPDEQKYMRALDEMAKLEKADPKPTFAVVKAKADKVKASYGLDQIKATDKGDIGEVFVKHAKQDNKKHLLEVPMMSAAERYKLLKKAMDEIEVQLTKKAGEDKQITESETKEVANVWKAKHGVIEDFVIVDGGTTWDLKVDIGDKQGDVRGRTKFEEVKKDGADEESKGDPAHKQIGTKIREELTRPSEKDSGSFEEFYAEKSQQAKTLEQKYQKELKEGIKLSITFGSLSEEKKDNDIDFNITIAPNDFVASFSVSDDLSFTLSEMSVVEGESRAIVQIFQKKVGKLESVSPEMEQGYLGQVISTPGSAVIKLPSRYATEAFSSVGDASKRFSLVIGINKYDDIGEENKKQIQEQKDAFSDPGYPLGIIGLLWSPNWKIKEGQGTQAKESIISTDRLREKVNEIKNATQKEEVKKKIADAEIGGVSQEGSKFIPYGKLRDKVNNHPYTSGFSQNLKKNVKDVYVHISDADSITMKVSGAESIDIQEIFGGMDKPLFEAYDEIIKNSNASGKPAVVSGGYRFTVDLSIDDGDQLRAIANLIDQEFRQAVAKIDPTILYLPEPNTIVKLVDEKIEVSFGIGRNESKTMMTNLLNKRKLSNEDIEFMISAGLTTDGKRFNAKIGKNSMTGQIIYHEAKGQKGEGKMTLDQFKSIFGANQMQASRRRVVASIKQSERYIPQDEEGQGIKNLRKFEDVLKKQYNSIFPHTVILGENMDSTQNWDQIKTLLPNFDPNSKVQSVKQNIENFYTSRGIFTGQEADKADVVANIMLTGSLSVKSSMAKLIENIND